MPISQTFKKKRFAKVRKIRKYLIYSIGEIVLVVLGILIAFSIDSWNEERKDRIKEKQVLLQLHEEYKANLVQLNEKIRMRENIITASHKVLNDISDSKSVHKDSLMIRLVLLLNDPTFDPILNDLFVSGNIRLIKNENLKRLLTNWSSEVIAVQEVEKRWAKLVDETVVATYIELGIARDALNLLYKSSNPAPFALEQTNFNLKSLGNSKQSVEVAEIISSKKLEGIVSVCIGLNNSANLQSYVLQKRIDKILNLLE